MSIERQLTTLLKSVCDRVFTDFAPVATARPYVTFQQIGGDTLEFVDRTIADIENCQIQISAWSDTRAGAVDLQKAIEVMLISAAVFQASPLSARHNDFDADIPVYGSSQDWSIWIAR